MKIAQLAEVKTPFSSYVEECEEGPVVVTENGRPKASLGIMTPESPPELGC